MKHVTSKIDMDPAIKGELFHQRLRKLMDEYVHFVYDLTLRFPPEERFGVSSQLRRSSLSVILNYIEGFARFRKAVNKNFLEISFGSLRESEYLVTFSCKRGYCEQSDVQRAVALSNEIASMLWGILRNL